ncbi:MAG: hypothetical protein ACI4MB_00970 [Candidatus Coproplasma sp.]
MKNKFLKSLVALTCVATLGLGVIAGCNSEPECEHVYTWTVHAGDESTCTTPGKRTGVCGICGDVKEEELPVDENAHSFTGEWQITKPTESADGLAVKTCANNPEHKAEVTLPQVTISGKGYDKKEFITVPTTATAGEMKLWLNSAYGEISFTVNLAKRKLDNMEDAVILASSLKDNVRSSSGGFTQEKNGIVNSFSYYFGDDYTYINSGADNIEYWYSLDEEGNVFAMSKKTGDTYASVVTSPDKDLLNGFHYNSGVNISSFYGAENGLYNLYTIAQDGREDNVTVDYKEIEEVKPEKGGAVNDIWFSFGYRAEEWFARIKVQFSTYNDGTLKNLTVETEIIRAYMFATEEDGTPIYYKEGDGYTDKFGIEHKQAVGDIVFGYEYPTDFSSGAPAYEYDKDGNLVYEQVDDLGRVIYITEEDGKKVYRPVLGGKEVELADGSVDYVIQYGDPLTEEPTLHDVYLYDAYGMQLLDSKGNPVRKIMAKGGYPVTKHYSDEHDEVSYRTVTFTQTKKAEGETVDPNPYPSDSLYIKDFDIVSAKAGNTTIDFVGGTATLPTNTAINLNIGNITPSTAGLKYDAITGIYVVDATGNRIKLKMDFNNGSIYKILGFYSESGGYITINSKYAGTVKFLFVTQSGKCEKEVEITFAKGAPLSFTGAMASVYTVTDGIVDYVDQVVSIDNYVTLIEGQSLEFKAIASGEEASYVSTDIYPTSATGLTFTQVEQDSYQEWRLVADTAGEYIVEMPYYDGSAVSTSVKTSFKVVVLPKKSVMETLSGTTFSGDVLISSGSGNPSSKNLTATFSADGEIAISVAGNEIVYTYGVDAETGELVTEYKSGIAPTQKSYDFTFFINEAGDLLVRHQTGMGNDTEEIVLTKQSVQ